MQKVIILTGPTAIGKSSLAIDLAQKINVIIINIDSMQIYSEIPIISAQPSEDEKLSIEHKLYGYKKGDENSSLAEHLQNVKKEIDFALQNKKIPIIVGGTPMYIHSMINGISNIPQINRDIRIDLEKNSTDELFSLLQEVDKKYSIMIKSNDRQRIIRGLEIKLSTNQSIIDFWNQKNNIFSNYDFIKILYTKSRDIIYQNCNLRFDKMIENEVINEIKSLINLHYNRNNTIFKATGIKELIMYLENQISLEFTIEKTKQSTRNYAKRQITWFRNKFQDFLSFDNKDLTIEYIINQLKI